MMSSHHLEPNAQSKWMPEHSRSGSHLVSTAHRCHIIMLHGKTGGKQNEAFCMILLECRRTIKQSGSHKWHEYVVNTMLKGMM